ncbi:Melatonin receptor type 1A-A [Trichinella spiralis]|uniref:Melatonin receptor type 1A-A n=1 Tax=Trichinella spiralis TaxID=6334 RepID=A0ABR3KFI3_TRISP
MNSYKQSNYHRKYRFIQNAASNNRLLFCAVHSWHSTMIVEYYKYQHIRRKKIRRGKKNDTEPYRTPHSVKELLHAVCDSHVSP